MTNPNSIRVSERIAENLATRRAADELFDFVKAKPYKTVTLDFKSVKFVSRSFAHEYLMRKDEAKKRVTEKNMAITVRKMFKLVSKEGDDAPHVNVASFRSVPLSAKTI